MSEKTFKENAECSRGNDVFDGCEKESMKSKIIKYAMSKIGTKRVSTLDGMTLEYKNKCYNIYVDDNNVTVEEIKEEPEEPEEPEETEKHYADYTSEDFIKADIAKECTTCPDFCEEDCVENAECARGNDVFDGCKSDSCIKAHKNFVHNCEQVYKQMKAINNPNWHYVSLRTLANIDNDMLDEKRRNYIFLYHLIKDFRKYALEIKKEDIYFDLVSNVLRNIQQLYFNNVISHKAYRYATRHIQVVSVEKGYFMSEREETFGFKKSRRYNGTLR